MRSEWSRALVAGALALGCAPAASRYHAARESLDRTTVVTRIEQQPDAHEPDAPFAGHIVLDRRELVTEVLRRNPSAESARQAWRSALARFPQETSLDDPMVDLGVAPWSFGSDVVGDGYSAGVSQAIPFPGKLGLRGDIALAEADATLRDYQTVRLGLATRASSLFDEYYLVARARAINAHHLVLLAELGRVALAQYEAGLAPQQDPLQAETEQAMLEHRQIELETQARLAAERINLLLHRRPASPLPPPPDALAVDAPSALAPDALTERAFSDRPELQAAVARVEARESAVALARREFLPDVTLWAKYDRFWQERDLRSSVGVSLNLPLQIARRRAALEQANAELARAESERLRTEDQIRLSVVTAVERVRESHHLFELTRDRLLPAARDRVVAARASYETGQTVFLALIDAERVLRDAELAYEDSLAKLSRRLAELDRATGRLPVLATPAGGQP